jgi:3-methylcrotonyl-CoA carboxylase alpha subunit
MQKHWRNNAYHPIRQQFKHSNKAYEVLLNPQGDGTYSATIGEAIYDVRVWSCEGDNLSLSVDGHRQHLTVIEGADNRWWIHSQSGIHDLQWINPLPEGGRAQTAEGSLHAPMPGQIRAVYVEVGQQVENGAVLMILEAMKMEHRIRAPYAGEVKAVHYSVGQSVQADAILLELMAKSD